MMLKPLRLPIMIDNEETETSALSGKPMAIRYHNKVWIDFYNIDAISEHPDENDDNRVYSAILVGGIEHICDFSQDRVNRMLQKHLLELAVGYFKN